MRTRLRRCGHFMKPRLHRTLQSWFDARFSGFSEVQKLALPHTLAGRNTLILAPTGSGKTLAAFLSILSELAHRAEAKQGLPNKTLAVYVSPLRSLTRDIERNLRGPLEALGMPIRMAVRTGDTDISDRGRMARLHPHLLLTTPESLSSLLSQVAWCGSFEVFAAVIDEVHSFAESKRGSLLSLTLERLNPKQRIGLSATASPPEAVARLLCGARPCEVAKVDARKAHKLEVAAIPEETVLPPAGYGPYRIAHIVAELVEQAQSSLVFTATRSSAEQLGLALEILLPHHEHRLAVHHASVDREHRLRIEADLSEGRMKAVVCSTSLELGVDFQAVDQVLLIGAPRGVSRALQRLGRSGHRVNGVASGSLIPLSLPDMLTCIALRDAARKGRLDDLKVPNAPLDVLAQVLLGMAVEREWGIDEAFELVRQAGPYLDMPRADFDDVLCYLAGGGKVLGGYGDAYGKIILSEGKFRVASRKVSRTYYRNIGTISDDYQLKIVGRGNRRLGSVEEEFIAELQPGEAFIIGGKSVRVRSLYQDMAMVEPAEGERVKTPRWAGGRMSVSARLADEELRLRKRLREGDIPADLDPTIRRRVADYLERQTNASRIPIDSPVQLERVRRDRAMLLVFHVIAGRSVNRSLAWVMGRRLGTDVGSLVANFDDYAFMMSINARNAPDDKTLRECFNPVGWREDLRAALEATELLGRRFRPVAETAQLLERKTTRGAPQRRMSSWNASLLYKTFQLHEPNHPLVREAVRECLDDELDAPRAATEAKRIYETPWETFTLDRPSPFSLPLFAFHAREVLLAQDPDKALDELVSDLYEGWA